jgi:hypothetical protein
LTYGTPTGALNCTSFSDLISNVTLATLSNTSTCGTGGYTIYTTPTTSLVRGSTNTITVAVGDPNDRVAVWIDYNQNNTFDATEYVALGAPDTARICSGSIVVPVTAVTGSTRMRVRERYSSVPDSTEACNAAGTWGEVEDYTITINPSALTYCTPTGALNCTSYNDIISNVTLATLSNTSTCGTGGYTVYVTPTTSLIQGSTNTVTVTVGDPFDRVAIWIDYNQNNTFDAAEYVALSDPDTANICSGSIVVPATALTGSTRMRVRERWGSIPDSTEACNSNPNSISPWGEIEDYTITISSGAPKASSHMITRDDHYKVFVTDGTAHSGRSVNMPVNSLSVSDVHIQISIYPNPASSVVMIKSPVPVDAIIRSMDGKSVMIQRRADQLDISQLADGVYLLYLYDASHNNIIKMEKLTKRSQ